MLFRPNPGDTITINQKTLGFCVDPGVPDLISIRTGQRSIVYKLQDPEGSYHALKVFTLAYRNPLIVQQAEAIAQYADIPGLSACRRTVITPLGYPEIVITYPELRYAILMPWLEGETWENIKNERQIVGIEETGNAAAAFIDVMLELEKHGLAHCNLNPDNVLFSFTDDGEAIVHLVGLENLFAPGIVEPEPIIIDVPAYSHPSSNRPVWGPEADRYAGALLVAEILNLGMPAGSLDSDTLESADGLLFDPIADILAIQWGEDICGLYQQALESLLAGRLSFI